MFCINEHLTKYIVKKVNVLTMGLYLFLPPPPPPPPLQQIPSHHDFAGHCIINVDDYGQKRIYRLLWQAVLVDFPFSLLVNTEERVMCLRLNTRVFEEKSVLISFNVEKRFKC